MHYILFGDDDFSRDEALNSITESLDDNDFKDANVTVLDGNTIGIDELTHTCNTTPFLSSKRTVIVKNLVSKFEKQWSSKSRRSQKIDIGEWDGLANCLKTSPPSSEIVFVDGKLSTTNPLFLSIKDQLKVISFPTPTPERVRKWIFERVNKLESTIDADAVGSLTSTIGPDLRTIANELDKLVAYKGSGQILKKDVEIMVSYTREANIFAAIDAIFEGKTGLALNLIHNLLESGSAPTYLLSMVARQVRLLIIANDLKSRNIPEREYAKKIGLSGYPLQKTLGQSTKFTSQELFHIHKLLIETDLCIKTSGIDEETALDILVSKISTGANNPSNTVTR